MRIDRDAYKKGRLALSPPRIVSEKEAERKVFETGVHSLQLDSKRDALIYVPSGYTHTCLASLAVLLHGAGGDAQHGLSLLRGLADEYNLLLLAPFSRNGSWDIITVNHFGGDVAFINHALEVVLDGFPVETSRLAIGGFSDGASYALSLGLNNGDLFTHILAFSPGFFYAREITGKPKLFISHGTEDRILPIDPCSRKIVPRLQKQGYDVFYDEFIGEHVIPPEVAERAVRWFLD